MNAPSWFRRCLPRGLSAVALTALLFGVSAPGCSAIDSLKRTESLNSLSGLSATVQQVADLTGEISKWSADLGSVISDPQLQQLGGFALRAAELLGSLESTSETLGSRSPSGLDAITDALGKLAGYKVEDLLPLDQPERGEATVQFSGIANALGQFAAQFLGTR
jgi:hypothetical protein